MCTALPSLSHMTRVERLASVVQQGLLSDNTCKLRGIGGVEIGYQHIKARRARRPVPCGAGGTLADYVPFYFAPRSPMLFAITRGQVTEEAARTEGIIYLVSSTRTRCPGTRDRSARSPRPHTLSAPTGPAAGTPAAAPVPAR